MGITNLLIKGDSKLVINQVTGEFNVKSDNLINLYMEAKKLLKNFNYVAFEHIKRNLNKVADKLANKAMDLYVNDTGNITDK